MTMTKTKTKTRVLFRSESEVSGRPVARASTKRSNGILNWSLADSPDQLKVTEEEEEREEFDGKT